MLWLLLNVVLYNSENKNSQGNGEIIFSPQAEKKDLQTMLKEKSYDHFKNRLKKTDLRVLETGGTEKHI